MKHKILSDLRTATDELVDLMESVEGTPAELTYEYLAAGAYSAFSYMALSSHSLSEGDELDDRDQVLVPKLLDLVRTAYRDLE